MASEKAAAILVCDPISEEAIDLLSKASGVQVKYSPAITAEELLAVVGSYDAVIVRSRTKLTAAVLAKAAKLKVIGRAGVGTDNIDSEAAARAGVKILNTPDALTNAVAEFTVALMLDLARRIPEADASMKRTEWNKSSFHGVELKGKVYGTIGIGRIGQRVAEIVHAMSMRILANDVIPVPPVLIEKYQIQVCEQEGVFAEADFVDLHVPLTAETRNLVDYEKMRKMKKTAYLINTSRGGVVNEKDLARALSEGLLAGAALDVFEKEPPSSEAALLGNPRVLLTPHIAGQTQEAQLKAGTQIAEAVLAFLRAS